MADKELEGKPQTGASYGPGEIALRALFFLISAGIAFHAFTEMVNGQAWSGVRTAGFALIAFGAAFSPLNFLYMCLPWTTKPLKEELLLGDFVMTIIGVVGLVVVVVGWSGS